MITSTIDLNLEHRQGSRIKENQSHFHLRLCVSSFLSRCEKIQVKPDQIGQIWKSLNEISDICIYIYMNTYVIICVHVYKDAMTFRL